MQQHKAHHLFRWARDAGKSVSRDEVADMVRTHAHQYVPVQACMLRSDAATQRRTRQALTAPPSGVHML